MSRRQFAPEGCGPRMHTRREQANELARLSALACFHALNATTGFPVSHPKHGGVPRVRVVWIWIARRLNQQQQQDARECSVVNGNRVVGRNWLKKNPGENREGGTVVQFYVSTFVVVGESWLVIVWSTRGCSSSGHSSLGSWRSCFSTHSRR